MARYGSETKILQSRMDDGMAAYGRQNKITFTHKKN